MSVLPVLVTGEQLKQAGIVKVTGPNTDWLLEALNAVVNHMPKLYKFTAEDLRDFLMNKDVDPPKHHNAWGALMHTLILADVVLDTGEHKLANRPSAHRRRLPVYIKL